MPIPKLLTYGCPMRWGAGLLAALPFALGCGTDHLKPEPLAQPTDLYWELEIDKRAITLSTTPPYDTVTLVAVPRNYRREPMAGLPAAQFTSSNPQFVQVTPAGMLVGVKPTSGLTTNRVQVVATLTVGNVRHTDTVEVRVVNNPTPPVLGSLSIHPIPPDSAKTFAAIIPTGPGSYALATRLRAISTTGAVLPFTNELISYRSSDTTMLQIISNRIRGQRAGTATVYASATYFGISKADTLPFRIGWPLNPTIQVNPIAEGSSLNYFVESTLTVGTGALITWRVGATTTPVDVTFTDPTNVAWYGAWFAFSAFTPSQVLAQCAGFEASFRIIGVDCGTGNFVLPALAGGVTSTGSPAQGVQNMRVFPVPGVYEYRSDLNNGVRGKIIVVDER